MRSTLKSTLIASLLVIVTSAIAAASASAAAPRWGVEGKGLGATEKISLAETAKVESGDVLLRWNGIETRCTTAKVKSGFLEGTTSGGAEKLTLSGCAVTPTKCEVVSSSGVKGAIETGAVVMTLESGEYVKIKPKSGTSFGTFKWTNKGGESCIVKGTYALNGSIRGLLSNPTEANSSHGLNFTTGSGSHLELGEESMESSQVSVSN
jgi:hypothetical protein